MSKKKLVATFRATSLIRLIYLGYLLGGPVFGKRPPTVVANRLSCYFRTWTYASSVETMYLFSLVLGSPLFIFLIMSKRPKAYTFWKKNTSWLSTLPLSDKYPYCYGSVLC